jgi:hypothetical protein
VPKVEIKVVMSAPTSLLGEVLDRMLTRPAEVVQTLMEGSGRRLFTVPRLGANAYFGINEGPRGVFGNQQGDDLISNQGVQTNVPPVLQGTQGQFNVGSRPNVNAACRVNYQNGGFRYFKK